MNLQSKKARLPIAALGVTALIAGGGWIGASSAFAVGETLTFLGADANAASIVAIDPVTIAASGLAFGVKVGGAASSDTRALDLQVLTAPTSGAVKVIRSPGNAAPAVATTGSYTSGGTSITVPSSAIAAVGDTAYNALGVSLGVISAIPDATHLTVPTIGAATQASGLITVLKAPTTVAASTTTGTVVPGYAVGDNVFFGATVAGTYTLRLFKDTGGDGAYQANADDSTPTFTLTVKTPADAFSLSAPTTVDEGTKGAMATITSTLSTTDIRGGSPAALASNVAGLLSLAIADNGAGGTGVTGDDTGGVAVYDATNGFYRYLATSSTQALGQGVTAPHTVTTGLTFNSVGVGTAKTTEVTTNGVTHVTLTAKSGQSANVAGTGAGTKIRTGISKVTYTALATDSSVPVVPQAGKIVTFTLTPGAGTTLADLSVNGTAVPTTGASAGQVTATTDSSGIASIDVTSAKTANGNIYRVDASSGSGSGTQIIATYTTAIASAVVITSTTAQLTPPVTATTVPVSGELTDQYGEVFQPPSSDTQQVVVSGSATGNAVVTGGMFTYNYVPTTTPVAGTTASLTFTYNGGPTATATIQWASTTAAASIKLTTPADGAKLVTLQDNTTPVPAQGNAGSPAFGNTTGAVTGTVYDASNAALAFKSVTLSGSDGVYFSTSATPDATHKLVKTLDVVTSNTGAISGAYVYFTVAGSAKVTATTGAVHADATVTTSDPDPSQKYTVSVNDTTASPGSTVIVTGKVLDIFGNPVPSATVTLSTGASTVGALGANNITTNSDGIFSTTFLAGSNQSGVVDLTATLTGQTANATAVTAYATAGVTLADGDYQAASKITVTEVKVTLTASPKTVGGKTEIGGTFLPNTSVDIYSKAIDAGSYTLLDSLDTDAEGGFGATYSIKKTTSFLAKANGLSSKVSTTKVTSTVTLTAKAYKKGYATLAANGSPSAKGTLVFWRSVAGPDIKLKTMTSNSSGNGTAIVKLPKGTRSVYVKFTAPGTTGGSSTIHKVTVK